MARIKTVGVIAEYNPFHYGHLYHLNECKRLSEGGNVVAVISGNFVQRGEPAVCDKWRRARMALLAGADIVVELPVCFASSAADYFASAAVKLLDSSGVVDVLCFGSESGDIGTIKKIAEAAANETDEYKSALKRYLSEGMGFAPARAKVLRNIAGHTAAGPNDVLGVEYCKALRKLNSRIIPVAAKRTEAASADDIRALVNSGRLNEASELMPGFSYDILRGAVDNGETARLDDLSGIFRYILRTSGHEHLTKIPGMTEGLWRRFVRVSGERRTVTEIIRAVKTKRYTMTRLRRAALHAVLGFDEGRLRECAATGPRYIRALGFRKEKAFLLGEMIKKASLPVVLNLKRAGRVLNEDALSMLRDEIRASDIYWVAAGVPKPAGYEYSEPLVIARSGSGSPR